MSDSHYHSADLRLPSLTQHLSPAPPLQSTGWEQGMEGGICTALEGHTDRHAMCVSAIGPHHCIGTYNWSQQPRVCMPPSLATTTACHGP